MSEGFATYSAELWVEHSAGDSAFQAGMAEIRAEIAASPVTRARPVIDTAQADLMKLLNTNSYQKGGWVLHMLRMELGDSAFFGGVLGVAGVQISIEDETNVIDSSLFYRTIEADVSMNEGVNECIGVTIGPYLASVAARHGDALMELGILYAPDYVINAGGLINVYGEISGWSADRAMRFSSAARL